MSSGPGVPRIICPAGVFAAHEAQIVSLTDSLNRAATLPEKAAFASRLRQAVDELLACPVREKDNINCRLCDEFSHLRANTADLILRTARLMS